MPISTADICDANPAAIQTGDLTILPIQMQWFGARNRAVGLIVTLEARGCNSEIRTILAEPGAGRILVIDAGDDRRALLGDRLALLAQKNGWEGVLINGNVRDRHALAKLDVCVLALGSWPERSSNSPGGIPGVPLIIGGAQVRSGEWLCADPDGVLLAKHNLFSLFGGEN